MAINPVTPGIHHINLRCADLAITKAFYQDKLGFSIPLENDQLFAFAVGGVYIVFKKADEGTKFDPHTIGTDHIAMACTSEDELERVAKGLTDEGIENTGVKTDPVLQKQYVAFKDPDRIQWEFYMV